MRASLACHGTALYCTPRTRTIRIAHAHFSDSIPYSGYFPGGKIFVDVQIFFHSWFNVRGVRRSRPHVFKIIGVVIPCI